MRILVSWLRDFVDVPEGTAALAEALNLRGLEVAGIEPAPPAIETAGGEDGVIDVEVTANRPDCLSVVGVAREVATIYDRPLRLPETAAAGGADATGASLLSVTLEDADLCPRYVACVAEVRVAPSPTWLAARVQAAGVRPINNVVDVTNYVMLEMGHPMHAFDLERLAGGELRIRRAQAGERIRTLDGQHRTLADSMLVIADARQPQAVAGVMGGADSEVTSGTRRVAFESAFFQPVSVRRTSKCLGLSTDASYRFERGADVSAPALALQRAVALLEQIGAGQRRGPIVDRYPAPHRPLRLTLRADRIHHVLGQRIDETFAARVLAHLGFEIADAPPGAHGGRVWSVTVPTRRVDVTREIDLIEEIARHYGYDRLPATFPPLTAAPAPAHRRLERDRLARRLLTAAGFDEAMTLSFIERPAAEAFTDRPEAIIEIANPLSAKFAVMRPSLLPGLVDAVAHNRRRGQRDVRLFEVGTCFSPTGEWRSAGFVWAGTSAPEHWSGRPREVDVFDIKGMAELFCHGFGHDPGFAPTNRPFLVAGRAAALLGPRPGAGQAVSPEPTLGVVGLLAPAVGVALGLEPGDEVYVAELDLDRLDQVAVPRGDLPVQPLPRHPSVVRDLSIVVDETLPAAAVRDTIRAAAPATLVRVGEFDRYQGAGIPAGSVSLSFHLTFRAPDRTLTDTEVQAAMDAIVGRLAQAHGAQLR